MTTKRALPCDPVNCGYLASLRLLANCKATPSILSDFLKGVSSPIGVSDLDHLKTIRPASPMRRIGKDVSLPLPILHIVGRWFLRPRAGRHHQRRCLVLRRVFEVLSIFPIGSPSPLPLGCCPVPTSTLLLPRDSCMRDCPKQFQDALLSSQTVLQLHLFLMSSNCAGAHIHRGGKGREAASAKCPGPTLFALHLVSGSRSSTLLVWLQYLLPLGRPPKLVVLTTILPSARNGELSPLDSRHHSACPGAVCEIVRRRLAHSKENSITVTQSLALNAANLSSNLLRGMKPLRCGLQSNILGNNMNNFHSRVDLLQTDLQGASKRPFHESGTDFMTNARTSNTFSRSTMSKLSNPVAMDRRSGRNRMSWTGSLHSTSSSSAACSD